MQKTIIASFMVEELDNAKRIDGTSFASHHEGYAMILEELAELFEKIRSKNPEENKMREEATKVGAMAIKFIMSMDKWFRPKENNESSECRLCQYNVMTAEELAEVGSDPCLTCHQQSNWKAKPEWDICDECGVAVRLGQDNDFFLESGTYGIPKGYHSKMVCRYCYETKYSGGKIE